MKKETAIKKWAFIGASTIAREWMLDAVRAQAGHSPECVVSSDAKRADAFAAQNNIPRAYDDLAKMLAAEKPDAVYISTTNELHKPQALAAVAAGAHVLCEKPLALHVADAAEMIRAAESAGVVFATNHHLRNAAAHREMKKLVADGAVGKVLAVRVFHAVSLPEKLRGWRLDRPDAGGGVVLDIAVHDADTVAFILGEHPVEVAALDQNAGMAKGMEDGCMSVWRFASGALCFSHESFAVPHAGTGLEIHGDRGSIIAREVMTQRPVGSVVLRTTNGDRDIPLTHCNLYHEGVARFANAMTGNGSPSADGVAGARSLATALAILKSAREKRATKVDYAGF